MDFPIIIIWVSPLSFLGASGAIVKFYSFSNENSLSKQKSPRCLRRPIWGYSVCLCPLLGLNELSKTGVYIPFLCFNQNIDTTENHVVLFTYKPINDR